MLSPLILIPARMASSRLPGKPLADIGGKPMIVHVLDRARAAGLGRVAVAAADPEIIDAVQAAGGEAVLTDPALPSGSDRVHAAAEQLDPGRVHDVIINLQGDLPGFVPYDLRAVLSALDDPAVSIGTLAAPVQDEAEAQADSVVKIACAFGPDGRPARALYFSRRAIPWGDGPLWHHVGVYAWRRTALDRFVSLPESPLEQRERLEQLRGLEAGMIIACAQIAHAPFGVDTPADLDRARRIYEQERQ